QEEIAMELQLEKVGSIQEVVIDREEDEYYVGRTQYDSPEVDPEVFVDKRKKLQLGNYYKVKIEKALPFELFGTLAQ
ncbi:MAG: TRAM domain-containing protein, partial [Muribaculaceae bacterium]|nr:TRAM domain-containing protein [Muribaculaceae bacterium]